MLRVQPCAALFCPSRNNPLLKGERDACGLWSVLQAVPFQLVSPLCGPGRGLRLSTTVQALRRARPPAGNDCHASSAQPAHGLSRSLSSQLQAVVARHSLVAVPE